MLLIFWGCLNNYLADVISKAAITPGRRALHYQWGQQMRLRFNEKIRQELLIQSTAFWLLEQRKDSQITASISCVPVAVCCSGDLASSSRANTEPDGTASDGFTELLDQIGMFVRHWFSTLFTSLFTNLASLFTGYSNFIRSNQKRKTPKWRILFCSLRKYFTKWINLKRFHTVVQNSGQFGQRPASSFIRMLHSFLRSLVISFIISLALFTRWFF